MENEKTLKNYLDNYVLLWDIVDDESIVYVPVFAPESDDDIKRYILYIERDNLLEEDSYFITHIFISEKEAINYKSSNKSKGMIFVKMKITNLYKSLDKYFKKYPCKKYKCFLSTIDVDGKAKSLIDIWCNFTNC